MTRTVFFELNGQPRSVRAVDHSRAPRRPTPVKAEAGNHKHIGAQMPGTVVTVNVRSGQDVIRGEVLLTLEAMKMEATVRAERDGQIATVLIVPGQQVESKDLLITLV